jgi:sulfur relay (sulfurtransferase) DsrC/TusE family protein
MVLRFNGLLLKTMVQGFLVNSLDWNEAVAHQLAQHENITFTRLQGQSEPAAPMCRFINCHNTSKLHKARVQLVQALLGREGVLRWEPLEFRKFMNMLHPDEPFGCLNLHCRRERVRIVEG